jgi:membrane protease YdiL (CAAX protease family)
MNNNKNRKSEISLIVFSVTAILSGWIGRGIDQLSGTTEGSTPGQLVWLLLPLLSVFIIKKVFKSSQSTIGFKPNFKANKKYYLISILFYPTVIIGYLTIGTIFGFISFNEVTIETIIPLFISMLIAQTFKNIFEEFSWRGYLAPELFALKLNRYLCHFIVGIVWALWHIPYNHIFIDTYRITTTAWYYPAFIFGIVVLSFAYGEIRYRVNSVWPALIMHTVGNALFNTLILSSLLNLNKADTVVTSIGVEGFIVSGITLILTFIIVRSRKQSKLI